MAAERNPILMMRRGSFLVPCAPLDGNRLEQFPANKALNVRITQPRSSPQNRLYWSMLNLVCDNLDQPIEPEALHEWVKVRCGVTATIPLRNGKWDIVPGSIAFENMPQDEFQRFFDRAKELLVEHVIPGLKSDALEREARAMLGEAA